MGLRHLHAHPVVAVVPHALHTQVGGALDWVAPAGAWFNERVICHLCKQGLEPECCIRDVSCVCRVHIGALLDAPLRSKLSEQESDAHSMRPSLQGMFVRG